MSTIAISLSLSGLVIVLAIAFQLRRMKARRLRLKGLELRPNCLLTRYPIAFLDGRRSLFRLFDHWNDIPVFLREHGYEVMIIQPAMGAQRETSLYAALKTIQGPCHVIADSSSEDLLKTLANNRISTVASLTCVRNPARKTSAQSSSQIRLDDLKPLVQAIEVFEIIQDEQAPLGATNAIARLLLWAHNATGFARAQKVDPIETAEFIDPRGWTLEARFLDLAISLAERDAQWCD